MHPVLFSIGSWDVGTHSVFVGLGVLVAGLYVVHESRCRGVWNEDMFVVVATGLVGGAHRAFRASGGPRADRGQASWRHRLISIGHDPLKPPRS